MTTSAWFDYNVYMANKLIYMQKTESAAGWDMPKLVKGFADAGFGGVTGAERHFEQYGQFEDLAPNAFFNATEYYRAKAAIAYKKDPKAVTDLEAASVQVALKDAGMSAWSHYEKFGNAEKVNPSNSFDTEAYMNAKLNALNNVKDGKQYTLAEVYDAFQAGNLSALEHFMTYGGTGSGEVAQKYDPAKPAIPAEFAVPENKQVNSGGGIGESFTLTPGLDNYVGTLGNDTFVAPLVDGKVTLNAGDKIDGGAGYDELVIYGQPSLQGVSVKNVEKVTFDSTDLTTDKHFAVDATSLVGLETVALRNIKGAADTTFTVNNMADGGAISLDGSITGFATRGDGSSANVSAIQAQFVDTATVGKLTVDGLNAKTLVQFGGKGLNTVNITGTTTKTGVVYLDDGLTSGSTAPVPTNDTITTVNIDSKGGLFSLTGSKIKTVNASASTGDLTLEFTKGSVAADLAVTTGSGNDKVIMDLTDLSAKDAIDLGAGDKDVLNLKVSATQSDTNDTLSGSASFNGISSSTEHKLTAAAYALINKVTGAEIFEVGNSAGDDMYASIDASKLSNINTIKASMHADITNLEAADVVQAKGGAVLKLTGKTLAGESSPQMFTFEALSSKDATDKVTISNDSTTQMTLIGAGNVHVNTKDGTAYNINAKDLQGSLTTGGSDKVDKIVVGAGGSILTSSQGKDVITLGAGTDVYNFLAIPQNNATLTNMDTLTGFTTAQDKIVFVKETNPVAVTDAAFTKVSKAFANSLDDTLKAGVTKAGVTVVTVTGGGDDAGVYAVYSADASFAVADDYVVKLAGVTADQLAAGDFSIGS